MRITPHIFDAFLKCATKCHLRSLGEIGSGNEYADWVRVRDESYKGEAARALEEVGGFVDRRDGPCRRCYPRDSKYSGFRLDSRLGSARSFCQAVGEVTPRKG